MNVNIVSKEDLQEFRKQLLEDIRQLLEDKPSATPKWLKSYQVREMLGISRGTLQQLRNNGTLTATAVGGLMFYEYDDIVKLMRSGKEHQKTRK